MSDHPQTQEAVALALLRIIAMGEGKMSQGSTAADQEWTLATYEKCLKATKGQRV
jgi:hypothetical protein